jgi:hypothetical protein
MKKIRLEDYSITIEDTDSTFMYVDEEEEPYNREMLEDVVSMINASAELEQVDFFLLWDRRCQQEHREEIIEAYHFFKERFSGI